MDDVGLRWWSEQAEPCPACEGTGVPIVLDMQDAETREAVQTGLAMLGGCGLGGAAFDRQCPTCGFRWSSGDRVAR